jgi:glutathione S-transferase
MMKLFTAGPSPFGRKVALALHSTGLHAQVEIIATNTAEPDSENRRLNPLGKIPTLLTDEGPLFDSRVIMEAIDRFAGGNRLLPTDGPERTALQAKIALIDGIMDAAVLIVYEGRMRPEGMQVQSVLDYQRGKIERSLAHLGAQALQYSKGQNPDAADIGLACLLDYLDFRQIFDWQAAVPSLVSWISDFAASVPGYNETLPEGIDAAPWRI